MSIPRISPLALCLAWFAAAWVVGQQPVPPEYEILKMDEGKWKATVMMWIGPDGQPDPDGEPMVSEGEEHNRMLGPFWLISTFKGEFAGMPFEGQSVSGYDAKTKKYTGNWVDSVSPYSMHMVGTYDAASKTLTSMTRGIGMDGQEVQGKAVVTYPDKDTRIMKMYEIHDGEEIRSMEIRYKRQ